jgi:3-methyladenine DNA glycosylase/8-oxoguanine DNA glycosylase
LRAVGPYALEVAIRGHGWFDLAPHVWDERAARLDTAVTAGNATFDLRIRPARDGVQVSATAERKVDRATAASLREGIRRMLRLDVDLTEFWAVCRDHESLRWVPSVRAGHLMQSTGLFEDLLKLLFTTNCAWAGTRGMIVRLVDALGSEAPSGRRAFPSAATCAARNESFWRETVRAGYRSASAVRLARGFADGSLREEDFEDPELPTDELRRRLLALPGFGPYAVGQALRGLGRYDDLALDSWCRAKMARMLGRRQPPSDGWFARRYRRYGPFAGLALWMELTAEWHSDGGRGNGRFHPFLA